MTALVTASGADLTRSHLIGAGGAGMSALAVLLVGRGCLVAGSDAKASHVLRGLEARGVRTAVGQRATNLDLWSDGPTAVVTSSAIRPDNPELVEARRRGLPVIPRAEALAALMVDRRAVCVAGTHGKTSTTSMLTVALQQAGADPSFAIGGELNESGAGAQTGTGDIFVAEADESDGSFLAFAPYGAIVTSIEPDHLDFHRTPEAYAAVFADFAARIRPGGFLVAGIDDPGVAELVTAMSPASRPRVITYGTGPDCAVRVTPLAPHGGRGRAALRIGDGPELTLTVQVPGVHMLANAAAAVAAGVELGLEPHVMVAGLAAYGGVRRRFELRGRSGATRVYDDYAHHPTEVAATLSAARSVAGDSRVVVVFQPHLYSRTVAFAEAFGAALAAADVVVVLDVYAAREDPVAGVSGALIADAAARAARGSATEIVYEPSLAQVPAVVADRLIDGDLVITMGAGDVTMIGPELLRELAQQHGDRQQQG